MYREVTMIEVRQVLRLRGEGLPKKRIAAQLGLDPKAVRRFLAAAATAGRGVPSTRAHPYVGQRISARADTQIKNPSAQAPGGQSIDASDYPVERSVYAMRNV